MAKYKQIAEVLKQQIIAGSYPDMKLPIEDALMNEFEVSRNTIRKAIDLLAELGILYRIQGSGVYIREMEHDNTINASKIRGISAEFADHKIKTKVISLDLIEATTEIAAALKIDVGSLVYDIKRIRYVDDQPYTIEYSYFNKEVIPYIGKEIAESSIYNYIEYDLKLKIGFADKYISATKLTSSEALIFQQAVGDPSLMIREKVYLSNGELFNSSTVFHNYQLAELFTTATK